MTLNWPWHKCQELDGVFPDLARVPHTSHYTIDCFSTELSCILLSF